MPPSWAVTSHRVSVSPSRGALSSHRGVPVLPLHWVSLSLSRGVSAPSWDICAPSRALCPAPAPGAAYIPLSSAWLLPSCPSLFLLWCFGVCSERLWERGCSPGSWGARRLVLPSPSPPPPGTSKLSRWRQLLSIPGAQGRLEAPGFRRSPPVPQALWDTCDLLFCVLFATSPPFSTERASREIPGEYPFEGLSPERLRVRARGKMNN